MQRHLTSEWIFIHTYTAYIECQTKRTSSYCWKFIFLCMSLLPISPSSLFLALSFSRRMFGYGWWIGEFAELIFHLRRSTASVQKHAENLKHSQFVQTWFVFPSIQESSKTTTPSHNLFLYLHYLHPFRTELILTYSAHNISLQKCVRRFFRFISTDRIILRQTREATHVLRLDV